VDLMEIKSRYQKGNSGDRVVHFFFYVLEYILDNTPLHMYPLLPDLTARNYSFYSLFESFLNQRMHAHL